MMNGEEPIDDGSGGGSDSSDSVAAEINVSVATPAGTSWVREPRASTPSVSLDDDVAANMIIVDESSCCMPFAAARPSRVC